MSRIFRFFCTVNVHNICAIHTAAAAAAPAPAPAGSAKAAAAAARYSRMLATSCSRRHIISSWVKLVSSLAGPSDSFCSHTKGGEERGDIFGQTARIQVEIYTWYQIYLVGGGEGHIFGQAVRIQVGMYTRYQVYTYSDSAIVSGSTCDKFDHYRDDHMKQVRQETALFTPCQTAISLNYPWRTPNYYLVGFSG